MILLCALLTINASDTPVSDASFSLQATYLPASLSAIAPLAKGKSCPCILTISSNFSNANENVSMTLDDVFSNASKIKSELWHFFISILLYLRSTTTSLYLAKNPNSNLA